MTSTERERATPLAVLVGMVLLGFQLGCSGTGADPREVGGVPAETIEALEALGYVEGTYDPDLSEVGVRVHVADRVFPGLNFLHSRGRTSARLMDMEGHTVHRWHVEEEGSWQHATLLPNGDLVVLVKDRRLFRIDRDSNLLWEVEGRFHHDLWVDDAGDIYALARRHLEGDRYHPSIPTVEDFVVVLGPDGVRKREVSVLRAIERSPFAFLLTDGRSLPARKIYRSNPRRKREFDILHTNHVEVLDGTHADRGDIYRKGNLLLCPRNIHCALILDGETEEVVWIWGAGNLIYPHHPTITDTGSMLIFNNGTEATRSEVLEIDPPSSRILWTYTDRSFYSFTRGSAQRLPNGNTLITESDAGYVFEVEPGGEIVWEYLNPDTRERDGIRMAIWRVWRVAPGELAFEPDGP